MTFCFKSKLNPLQKFADSIDPNSVGRNIYFYPIAQRKRPGWTSLKPYYHKLKPSSKLENGRKIFTLKFCQHRKNSENDNLSSSSTWRPDSICSVHKTESNIIASVSLDTPRKQSTVKINRIKLPKFSDEVNQWLNFYDVFISAVYGNTDWRIG